MFKEKYSKFFEKIGRSKFMVLSTSKDDFVTSRMVSIIVIDGKFYFQTDKNFKKWKKKFVIAGNKRQVLKKLKRKKKYYVRIRYKVKVDGKTYYSLFGKLCVFKLK